MLDLNLRNFFLVYYDKIESKMRFKKVKAESPLDVLHKEFDTLKRFPSMQVKGVRVADDNWNTVASYTLEELA